MTEEENENENQARQMGAQPLGQIMERLDLSHHDLVTASTEQLTHKQVRKARKGRRVSRKIQSRIEKALHAARPDSAYRIDHLFNY